MTRRLEMTQRRVRLSTWPILGQGLAELRNVWVATNFDVPGTPNHEERPSKIIKTVVYLKGVH